MVYKLIEEVGLDNPPNHKFITPNDVFYDKKNDLLLVTNSSNDSVNMYTIHITEKSPNKAFTTKFIKSFGTPGDKPGEFTYPSNVIVHDDIIYVTDTYNGRIQKFDLNGEFIKGIGRNGDGLFTQPHGICIYENTIYVVDTINKRVLMLDLSGNCIGSFGSGGISLEQFSRPHSISAYYGIIYVTDSDNHKIAQFKPDGTFIGVDAVSVRHPRGIDVCEYGKVISQHNAHSVIVYTHNQVHPIRKYLNSSGEEIGFIYPRGVKFLDENHIIVCDVYGNKVLIIEIVK